MGDELLRSVLLTLKRSGEPESNFGRRVAGDPRLVSDLRQGRQPRRELREKIEQATGMVVPGPRGLFQSERADTRSVACPRCGADEGQSCRSRPCMDETPYVHLARVKATLAEVQA